MEYGSNPGQKVKGASRGGGLKLGQSPLCKHLGIRVSGGGHGVCVWEQGYLMFNFNTNC